MSRLLGWMRIAVIDLRGDLRRFVILFACLALGVGTIAAVSSVGSALQAAVARDARIILGGDIEVRQRGSDVSDAQRAAIEALGETARSIDLSARASANDQSLLLDLRAVSDNYPLVGTAVVDPPAPLSDLLPPVDGLPGTVVDQGVLDRLGLAVGQNMRIGNADFAIRGVLVSVPDQAAQGFQLGLPAIISDATLADAGLQQQGVLSRFGYKVLLGDTPAATAMAELDQAFPDSNWDLREPEDARSRQPAAVLRSLRPLPDPGRIVVAAGRRGRCLQCRCRLYQRAPQFHRHPPQPGCDQRADHGAFFDPGHAARGRRRAARPPSWRRHEPSGLARLVGHAVARPAAERRSPVAPDRRRVRLPDRSSIRALAVTRGAETEAGEPFPIFEKR
ncbi:hypothetical protein G5575_14930 [Devosia chinhatensis]|uniref:MacB-like periplasmic core domain-containing protein n=1 Tax=Devosia aurantiaca TaxID=2714858 RepID=A0A6M1SNS5_9HYPH|nr:hypothetical protein [Devosia aurantiaca]